MSNGYLKANLRAQLQQSYKYLIDTWIRVSVGLAWSVCLGQTSSMWVDQIKNYTVHKYFPKIYNINIAYLNLPFAQG